MTKGKRQLRLRVLLLCLVLGVSAGCGHVQRQKEGEWEESQRYEKESKYTEYEVSTAEGSNSTDMHDTTKASADADSTSSTQEQESSVQYFDENQEISTMNENNVINESSVQQAYHLTEEDKAQVLARLAAVGESYGLIYYPEITESETWDTPTPIYEEELLLGREYVMQTMVEYSEGAFVLMQMEGCKGFALGLKEYPETVTDAYYEIYVYWL